MDASLATPLSKTGRTSAREHALHLLGTTLPGATSAQEAMKFSRLTGWNLRKSPATTQVGDLTLTIPGLYAMLRDNPVVDGQVDILGAVGNGYKILQNEQFEPLLETLKEESGAVYETAGELDGGKQVFVTMRLPGAANVGGVDKVDIYIAVIASHDGETASRLMVTPVRARCQSTLNLAFKNAKHIYPVRHTTGADKLLHQQARAALDFTYDYVDAFQEQAKKLIEAPLTQSRFESLISDHYGAPAGADIRTITRAQNKLDKMAELFSDSFALDGVRETAWAGLTALTEWHDHHFPVRKVEGSTELEVRSRKALLDPAFKNAALKTMLTA